MMLLCLRRLPFTDRIKIKSTIKIKIELTVNGYHQYSNIPVL